MYTAAPLALCVVEGNVNEHVSRARAAERNRKRRQAERRIMYHREIGAVYISAGGISL
jgi:hypothetical protein